VFKVVGFLPLLSLGVAAREMFQGFDGFCLIQWLQIIHKGQSNGLVYGKISLVLRINSTRFTVNCPMTVNFREGENHCLGTILSDVKPQNWKGTGSSVKIELARRFSLIFLCWSNMSNLDFETWNAIETMINHPWFF
jgi:hypothetical protein